MRVLINVSVANICSIPGSIVEDEIHFITECLLLNLVYRQKFLMENNTQTINAYRTVVSSTLDLLCKEDFNNLIIFDSVVFKIVVIHVYFLYFLH